MKSIKFTPPEGFEFGEFNKQTGEVELIKKWSLPPDKTWIYVHNFHKDCTGFKDAIIFYEEGQICFYGFDFGEEWIDTFQNDFIKDKLAWSLIDLNKVEERLTAEAKKRGYVKGIEYKDKMGNNYRKLVFSGNFNFNENYNCLFDGDGVGAIFEDGQWAEILPAKPKYPTKIEEVKGTEYFLITERMLRTTTTSGWKATVSTESRAKAFLALMQLVELCDAYNKADDTTMDWNNPIRPRYSICCRGEEVIAITVHGRDRKVLSFAKEETRDLFFETFHPLIEEAKELI
jgi:hypothetical protein